VVVACIIIQNLRINLSLVSSLSVKTNLIKKNKPKYNILLKDEKTSNEISLKYEEEDNIYMQVISSGPNYEFPAIRDNYIKLIQEARKSVFIQTPYFVPDDLLLDTLKSAVLSGIDVKIMIPNKADHPFIYWINQYYVAELLRLGANIYRYENGFIHSKTLLIDFR